MRRQGRLLADGQCKLIKHPFLRTFSPFPDTVSKQERPWRRERNSTANSLIIPCFMYSWVNPIFFFAVCCCQNALAFQQTVLQQPAMLHGSTLAPKIRQRPPCQRQRQFATHAQPEFYEPETSFLVTDSVDLLTSERPSIFQTLSNPRDILALVLVATATVVSTCNVQGTFNTALYHSLQNISIALGVLSGVASIGQVATGYMVDTSQRRRLVVNDQVVTLYSGVYSLCVSWLAARALVFPSWIVELDIVLPWMATFAFIMSVVVPAITLTNPMGILDETPPLSNTELLRARGVLAIGILACVFAPDCIAFALGGQSWWGRVNDLHPSQSTLESSTALFALYANEASMISHRCAKSGVAPFAVIVPVFAFVCLVLAIVPCAASLFWLGNDISFFSFYRE